MDSVTLRSSKPERRSPFFRDLSTPFSSHRSGGGGAGTPGSGSGRFATPSQAAAVSALWRENFGAADPPPPPVFTLGDRVEFSPEPDLIPPPLHSPSSPSPDSRTPPPAARGYFSSSPSAAKLREEATGSAAVDEGLHLQRQHSAGSFSWWSPAKGCGSGDRDDMERGSPVEGVVDPGALIVLPPPREVAKPEMQRNSLPVEERLDGQEWVTVYGFSLGDTNLVLREFERCGVILKHILGPRDANWMHILYQSRFDAKKALSKHGTQINSVLIIGVKPVDPQQKQYLNESLESNHIRSFMTLEPAAIRSSFAPSLNGGPIQPHLKQSFTTKISDSGHQMKGAIASPAKSLISKVMDLMFGI